MKRGDRELNKLSAAMIGISVFLTVAGCANSKAGNGRTALANPIGGRAAETFTGSAAGSAESEPAQASPAPAGLQAETLLLGEGPQKPKPRTNRYFAHRGYSSIAPENTIPAFRLGFERGADGIELDMQMSKDGKVVVMHDITLDRTSNGKGPLKERTYAELSRLDAGAWFTKGNFKGTKIPLLQSVFEAVHPKDGQTVITEIKDYRTPADVEAMMKVIQDGGWEKNTMVSSFHWSAFEYVRKHSKTIPIGFLCDSPGTCRKALELAKKDRHAILHAAYPALLADPGIAEESANSGVAVAAWTVDRPDVRQKLELQGVHAFITNEPETLKQIQ